MRRAADRYSLAEGLTYKEVRSRREQRAWTGASFANQEIVRFLFAKRDEGNASVANRQSMTTRMNAGGLLHHIVQF